MSKSIDIVKAPKQKEVTPESMQDNNREKGNDKNDFFERDPEPERSDPLFFYLVLGLCAIILLIALSIWLVYKSINSNGESKSSSTTSSSTSGTTGETASSSAAAIASETTSASQAGTVNKANVKIRIVNGNGRNGEANLIKTALTDDGFKNITTGNAASRYATTIIYYNTGKIEEAKAVEKVVSAKYKPTLTENPGITKDNDVLVALGNK